MILISFNSRNDNLGDKLIFSCLYAELELHDEVYVFGNSPDGFKQKALRLREAFVKAFLARVKGHKVFVFHSPGARFLPKNTVNPKLVKRLKDKAIFFIWSLIGAKLHVVGISIDERSGVERYKRFKRYETIGVRDKRSVDLLSEVVKSVNLTPDMAFLRLPLKRTTLEAKVFVSLRQETPDDRYDSKYKPALEASLSSALTPFFDKQWNISFFSNVIEDQPFNLSLSRDFSSTNNYVDYVNDMPVDLNYTKFFDGYGAVVSNRLHVLIPAMTEGLLPVALVSKAHSKIINLFSSYGLDRFLIYTDDNAGCITEKVADLLDQQDELRNQNYSKLCALKAELKKYIASVVASSK